MDHPVVPVLVSDPSRVDIVEAVIELVDGEDDSRVSEVWGTILGLNFGLKNHLKFA